MDKCKHLLTPSVSLLFKTKEEIKKIHILMLASVQVDKIFRQLVPKEIHMLENEMNFLMDLIMNTY